MSLLKKRLGERVRTAQARVGFPLGKSSSHFLGLVALNVVVAGSRCLVDWCCSSTGNCSYSSPLIALEPLPATILVLHLRFVQYSVPCFSISLLEVLDVLVDLFRTSKLIGLESE